MLQAARLARSWWKRSAVMNRGKLAICKVLRPAMCESGVGALSTLGAAAQIGAAGHDNGDCW
jgi:hypothetical protein